MSIPLALVALLVMFCFGYLLRVWHERLGHAGDLAVRCASCGERFDNAAAQTLAFLDHECECAK